jgi:hypothetical protein
MREAHLNCASRIEFMPVPTVTYVASVQFWIIMHSPEAFDIESTTAVLGVGWNDIRYRACKTCISWLRQSH